MNIAEEGQEVEQRGSLPRARRFEELEAWEKARLLTGRIYEITRDGSFERDYGLVNQTQRAAVSVMANIAEGFDRRGAGEFSHFLGYSRGSCAELRSNLYIALDAGYINVKTFDELIAMAEEVTRILYFLIASVNKSKK